MNCCPSERACLWPGPPNTTGRSGKYHGKWRTVRQIPRVAAIFSDREKIGGSKTPPVQEEESSTTKTFYYGKEDLTLNWEGHSITDVS